MFYIDNAGFRGWGGTLGVVFVLFLCALIQQESHIAKALQRPRPGGASSYQYNLADFSVYYVAGKATDTHRYPELYYPPAGSWRANPIIRIVDPHTAWADIGRAQGQSQVQYFIYPPLFSLLMVPFFAAFAGIGLSRMAGVQSPASPPVDLRDFAMAAIQAILADFHSFEHRSDLLLPLQ